MQAAVAAAPARPPERASHRSGIPYEVVHRLPGRVRLRLDRQAAARGAELAGMLAAQDEVRQVRWTAAARSLTIGFEPSVDVHDLIASLPSRRSAPSREDDRPQVFWRAFLAPAASLVLGLSGAGLLARLGIALASVPIARRAVDSLRRRRLSIDVLDTVAVTLLIVTGDLLAAGVSVCLIETGERIREQATGRTRRVMRGWLGANPRGIRLARNGHEPRISVDAVTAGDRVVVYAGENVPVDGVVVGGSGLVDMRSWTGETVPIEVAEGAAALAGSTMTDGRLVIQVTATGDETRAGRLAVALEEALAANTRVSDFARRVADRFVLPVLLAAGGVLAVTRNVSRTISLLIFDFGTGVRVSIPTTILATMVAGARHGVIFKSGRAVETLAGVDTVVFDKTGTLTSGRLAVVKVVAIGDCGEAEALRLAASAEGHLPHPIAGAIRRAARARGLEPTESGRVRYYPGGGVEAEVDGHRVVVGDRRLLDALDVRIPFAPSSESLSVLVAVDGRAAARIRLRDSVRQEGRTVLGNLRRLGVAQMWLASGDHHSAARAVARHLGLDDYGARMMPEDKAELVGRLRSEGRAVAVVGDGINDAPAMAAADVSIAVPRGADLARETADVVLVSERLDDLVTAFRLSRAAMQIVRQNVGIVALPNSAGMGLSAIGSVGPLAATLVNNGSTLLAAGNALRPLLRSLPG